MTKARNIADLLDANGDVKLTNLDNIDLTNLSATNLTSGTIPNARFPSTLPAIDGSNLTNVTETKPTVSSISPTTIQNAQTQIVITGTNFETTPNVEFISSTGAITFADTVTRNSATQLTVNATLATDGTYFIRVENPNGLAGRSSTALLTVSDAPVFSTNAGSLGDLYFANAGSFTVAASSDSAVTFSKVSGTFPSGLTLNTSTGVISGTENSGGSSNITYNFTIRATDAENQTADRAFSIDVKIPNYFGDGSDGSLST